MSAPILRFIRSSQRLSAAYSCIRDKAKYINFTKSHMHSLSSLSHTSHFERLPTGGADRNIPRHEAFTLICRGFSSTPPDDNFDDIEYIDTSYESGRFAKLKRTRLNREDPLYEKVNKFVDLPMGKLHPLDIAFTCVDLIIDCCKMQTLEGMKHARDLLDRLIAEKRYVNEGLLDEEEVPVVIPAVPFEKILYGWAKLTPRAGGGITRMKEIIDLMAQENQYDVDLMSTMPEDVVERASTDKRKSYKPCQPTTSTFNILLRALAEAARRSNEAAFEAESYLGIMIDHHENSGWYTKPNTRSYSHVLTAFANTGAPFASGKVDGILSQMKDIHETEKENYEVEFGVPYNALNPQANFRQIVTPDSYAYAAAISAHANSGGKDSTEKAYALLMEIIEGKQDYAVADNVVFSSTINALARFASKKGIPSQRFKAAQRAENLLWTMIEASKDQAVSQEEKESDEIPKDDIISANYDDDEEEEMVEEKQKSKNGEGFAANVITYNTVLNAWAKSDVRESAPAAEALLQRMLEDCMNDKTAVQPDSISFNTVINAWARFHIYDPNAPQKAEDLMNFMYEIYHSGRLDESVKPDAKTYTSVINAWARGGDGKDNARNARRLLDSMLYKYDAGEDDMKPNIVSFTAVLNAAVNCPPQDQSVESVSDEDAFDLEIDEREGPYGIALRTYDELWNDSYGLRLKADHFTFAAMLQVISIHTAANSGERRQFVERIFEDACSAGQVSSFVIRALQEACPSKDLLARILGSPKLADSIQSVNELPRDWSRHIGREKRFRFLDNRKRRRNGNQRKKHRN